MKDWMEGYNSEVEYTPGFYRELSPEFLNFSLVLNNLEPIDLNGNFNYLELGCGQGFSALVFASLYPNATFYAIDYNPTHIAQAQSLAQKANLTNIYFIECSFQDIVDNPDLLPKFDFITFHGIFSWVNDKNRDNLLKICLNHAKSGAVVYNSYNTKPAWNIGEVFQQIVKNLSKELNDGPVEKILNVIKIVEKLNDLGYGFFNKNQEQISKMLKKIRTKDFRYVIHEYLHDNWKAFYFNEVHDKMEKAKLNYLASSEIVEYFFQESIKENLYKQIPKIKNKANFELIKDLIFNRGFREDIYVRGFREKITSYDKKLWFMKKKWIVWNRKKFPDDYKINYFFGEITLSPKIYNAILNLISNKPLSGAEIYKSTNIPIPTLMQALTILYKENVAAIYEKKESKAKELNSVLLQKRFLPGFFKRMVAPNISNAITLSDKSWIAAYYNNIKNDQKILEYVFNSYLERDLTMNIKGKPLKSNEMKLKLKELYSKWKKEEYPMLKSVGII